MKTLCLAFGVACLSVFIPTMKAQAVYAAERESRVQVGAAVTYLNTDYTPRQNAGVTTFGDFDFRRHLGLEAEAHFGGIISPDDIGENTYLVGPRFVMRHFRYAAYGKALVGRGTISQQLWDRSSTYNIYAIGGGLEYTAKRKLVIRAIDFEMQKWPDFTPHTLSPYTVTFGAAYVLR